jgi:outer membrane lipase/esterase
VQANPAQAQAIIGGAVTAQIGLVGALTQAGAQYILVPTIPDLGLTPSSRAGGAVAMAQGTALTNSYNSALFGGLASAGLHVIPLDTFHFLQEVVANPGAYGITNVTGTACQPQITAQSLTCNPTSLVNPGRAEQLSVRRWRASDQRRAQGDRGLRDFGDRGPAPDRDPAALGIDGRTCAFAGGR